MHRLQTQELLDDEEPEEAFRSGGTEEVLPLLQQAHGPQGNEVRPTTREGRGARVARAEEEGGRGFIRVHEGSDTRSLALH